MKLHNGNAVEGSRKAKNIPVRLTGMSLETSQREDQRYNTTLYILVMLKSNIYLATCSGCSLCSVCLSAARSQRAGGARPVSDSLMPVQLKKNKSDTKHLVQPSKVPKPSIYTPLIKLDNRSKFKMIHFQQQCSPLHFLELKSTRHAFLKSKLAP